jgi:hypothetical protein
MGMPRLGRIPWPVHDLSLRRAVRLRRPACHECCADAASGPPLTGARCAMSLAGTSRFKLTRARRCAGLAIAFCGGLTAPLAGCALTVDGPSASDRTAETFDRLDARQPVTSSNDDGIWTALTSAAGGKGSVSGRVAFTGPAGKTRGMGMCLLQQYRSPEGQVACNTADDCDAAPAVVPAGGHRYCLAPNNNGPRTCHVRPGDRETYCIGSPALGLARIEPGTYSLDVAAPAGTQWVAIACFEGCAETAPSISATATVR